MIGLVWLSAICDRAEAFSNSIISAPMMHLPSSIAVPRQFGRRSGRKTISIGSIRRLIPRRATLLAMPPGFVVTRWTRECSVPVMGRLLARLLIATLGLALAFLSTAVVIAIAVTLFELPDQSLIVSDDLTFVVAIIGAVIFLIAGGPVLLPPLLGFVVLAELLRWRGLFLHLGVGLAMGLLLFALGSRLREEWTMAAAPQALVGPFVAAGLAGALTYWLIAGRGAGAETANGSS
jgi:hypothetical protein